MLFHKMRFSQVSQTTSSLPGHSSSYVFTQWGAGKEAKVFTYNLTDDHVDKLKFGPAKDSALTFDFTGLFEKQESPRQSQPKQKPKQKSPKPRKLSTLTTSSHILGHVL